MRSFLCVYIFSTKSISKNISGMLIHERKCEISAIPDAVVVSLPYAAGITTVVSPSGIATEQTAQMKMVFDTGSR